MLGSLVIASIALLSWRPTNNDDTFMYLSTGRWVLDHHTIPTTDPFSWTFHGHAWQSTGWGWGLILALADRVAGTAGVAATKPVLVVAAAAGAIWTARHLGARVAPAFVCAGIALLSITPWITDRAQMASYAFFPLSIGLALRAIDDDRLHFGWWAALIAAQVIWINVHSAALISAPFLLATLAGCALDTYRHGDDRSLGRLIRSGLRPAVVFLTATVALFANPWGRGMLTHAEATRDLSRATISEWAPLFRSDGTAAVPIAVTVAAAAAFWIGRRRFAWTSVLPVALGAAMTVDAIRNAPFLVLAAAMFVPPVLPRLRARAAGRRDLARVGTIAFAVTALVIGILTVPGTGAPGPGIPVHATAALPARCQLRNLSGMGGYVMATRPDVPVSADGRNDLYGLAGYAQNSWFTGTLAEARSGLAQIDREGTDCALARPDNTLVKVLEDAGWRVVGLDPSGVSLVRPGPGRSPRQS